MSCYSFSDYLFSQDGSRLPHTIYHYTSPAGLLGILGSKQSQNKDASLWFSRADCLNDISEGKIITELYNDVLYDLHKHEKIGDTFFYGARSITFNQYIAKFVHSVNGKSIEPVKHDAYICCFAKTDNSLPMWNYYIKNDRYEGYCIGFETNQLVECITKNMSCQIERPEVILGKVMYNKNAIKSHIASNIVNIYNDLCNSIGCSEEPYIIGSTERKISAYLTQLRYLCKDNCFEHEQEVRLIIFFDSMLDDNADKERNLINYRSVNGIITPYLVVNVSSQFVSSITIAPSTTARYDEVYKSMLNEYIHGRSMDHIEIIQKDFPVRY